MKLFEINFIPNPNNPTKIILEGYGVSYDFDYHGNQVTDPRPKALSLGKWRSHRGNDLMGGINLNYLSPEQIERLQQNLQTILRRRSLKDRARTLRHLMPDVFNSAYRTYYKDAVDNVDKGTLKFAKTPKDEPDDVNDLNVPRPETAPDSSTDAADIDEPTALSTGLADKVRSRHKKIRQKPKPKDTKPKTKPEDEVDDKVELDDIGTDEVEPEELEDADEDQDEEEV